MDNQTLWKTVLEQLELDLSPTVFKTWFKETRILKNEGSLIEIACPTSYAKERLERYHQAQIKKVLDGILKRETNVLFRVKSTRKERDIAGLGPLFEDETKDLEQRAKKSGLSPRYTLSNFVVGNNNNLAYAVALGIIENPGKRHNPVFIYSDVGLGKTHLLQAIGNEILRKHPQLKVLYATSEDFTNELIQAIQSRTTNSFKRKFRNVDVLLIDDIQFIAGRESSQEEFFHTFNALYLEQKQIVLTSDRPPKAIAKLEKRLSSRFGSGMMADMQPPDVDVRLAILRKKQETLNLKISDELLSFIAEAVPSNIRELEGALNRVIMLAQTRECEPTIRLAQEVLGDLPRKEPPTPEKIISHVCNFYDLKTKDLVGKRRPKRIAQPRQIAMYLMKNLTDMTLSEIGDFLGGRDHTTIIHGVEKIEKLIVENSGINRQVSLIKSQICE